MRAIGTLGTIDEISIGGRIYTDLTNIIILYGWSTGGGGVQYSGLLKSGSGSSTAYQVTLGKTLTISAVRIFNNFGSGAIVVGAGQSDTALTLSSAVAPTNPIYFGSQSSTFAPDTITTTTYGSSEGSPFNGKIASQKYGFLDHISSTLSLVAYYYGYEA